MTIQLRKVFFVVLALTVPAMAGATIYEVSCEQQGVQALADTIAVANADPGADTIYLAAGDCVVLAANNDTDGPNGLPSIRTPVTIVGAGSDASVIERDPGLDRSFPFRLFHVAPAGSLELIDLTVQGGELEGVDLSGGGGAIFSAGTTSLRRATVIGNRADFDGGGGLYVAASGRLQVDDSAIVENLSAFGVGGGVFNAGGTVRINSTTISDNEGDVGGGLFNAGTVSLVKVELANNFSDSSGGAIGNIGAMTLDNSRVVDNIASTNGGGGIFNGSTGNLSIVATTVAGNEATDYTGGGLQNNGRLTVEGSTISGNTAAIVAGGGLFNGSIVNPQVAAGSRARVTNSTVSGNVASLGGAGIGNRDGTVIVVSSTVADNITGLDGEGGGLLNQRGRVLLGNTIVAGNGGGGDCSGTDVLSFGFNLDSDSSCALDASLGDIANADPALGPLTDNGGPTETHALLDDSPALSAIPSEACSDVDNLPIAIDQRGVSRPQGAGCDIGAFERQVSAGDADTDNDGLPDAVENKLGSDRNAPDSDRDGLVDGIDTGLLGDFIANLPVRIFKRPWGSAKQGVLIYAARLSERHLRRGMDGRAIRWLEFSRAKLDGCTDSGRTIPQPDDWIVDCDVQLELRSLFDLFITNIETGA